jgi:hypothetical protein
MRAANMVMLGALLEIAGVLPQASIDAALRRWSRIRAGWNWTSAPGAGQGTVCRRSRSQEV